MNKFNKLKPWRPRPGSRLDYETASFRDFRYIAGYTLQERALHFEDYCNYLRRKKRFNYHLPMQGAIGPIVHLKRPGDRQYTACVSLVSNDYLGYTQHPLIKNADMEAIAQYGTGAGASPAIGGFADYHEKLEADTARFFGHAHCVSFNTGYTANSAALQCLLGPDDIAIVDSAVHASVYEGIRQTTVKRIVHNDIDHLAKVLEQTQHRYPTRLVVVDGVYSQDGDRAPLAEITHMAHHYGALVFLDDAHGIGVVGKNGRGVIEAENCLTDVDFIMGTYSKALGHRGGFIVSRRELVHLLRYMSDQYLFSTADGPTVLGICKALALVDEEPQPRERLRENITYLASGLKQLGLDIGTTDSAIIPVKLGHIPTTLEVGKRLLDAGIYANPIMYPAVAKKDARIRMNITALHTREHLDVVLNAWADVIAAVPGVRKEADR